MFGIVFNDALDRYYKFKLNNLKDAQFYKLVLKTYFLENPDTNLNIYYKEKCHVRIISISEFDSVLAIELDLNWILRITNYCIEKYCERL